MALRKESRTQGLRQPRGCPEAVQQVDALTQAAALLTLSLWFGVEKRGWYRERAPASAKWRASAQRWKLAPSPRLEGRL